MDDSKFNLNYHEKRAQKMIETKCLDVVVSTASTYAGLQA